MRQESVKGYIEIPRQQKAVLSSSKTPPPVDVIPNPVPLTCAGAAYLMVPFELALSEVIPGWGAKNFPGTRR